MTMMTASGDRLIRTATRAVLLYMDCVHAWSPACHNKLCQVTSANWTSPLAYTCNCHEFCCDERKCCYNSMPPWSWIAASTIVVCLALAKCIHWRWRRMKKRKCYIGPDLAHPPLPQYGCVNYEAENPLYLFDQTGLKRVSTEITLVNFAD